MRGGKRKEKKERGGVFTDWLLLWRALSHIDSLCGDPHILIPCVDDSPRIDSMRGGPSPPSEDEGKEEEEKGGRMRRLYILIPFVENFSHIDPLCGEPPHI